MSETCTCRELHLNSGGRQGTGCFELDRDCPLHGLQAAYDTADRVLACDEMQAIRKALRNMYDTRVRECGYGAAHEWLRALNLPLSVIAWVLEGEQ